jgi:hypothetical protein
MAVEEEGEERRGGEPSFFETGTFRGRRVERELVGV